MKFLHWPTLFLRARRARRNNDADKLFSELYPPTKVRFNKVLAQNRCSACKGVFHEATGHRHSEKTVVCGPCAKHFFSWVKGHTNRKWGKTRFYDHATRPGPREG